MTSSNQSIFKLNHENFLNILTLKAFSRRPLRPIHVECDEFLNILYYDINDLSEQQLLSYFNALLKSHSWSTVKLDLYGLKFFYKHVLNKPWTHIDLIKPPRTKRLSDILTVEEAATLFKATLERPIVM